MTEQALRLWHACCRYLDLSNSCYSTENLMGVLEALELRLCILTIPTAPLPAFAADWQPVRPTCALHGLAHASVC